MGEQKGARDDAHVTWYKSAEGMASLQIVTRQKIMKDENNIKLTHTSIQRH